MPKRRATALRRACSSDESDSTQFFSALTSPLIKKSTSKVPCIRLSDRDIPLHPIPIHPNASVDVLGSALTQGNGVRALPTLPPSTRDRWLEVERAVGLSGGSECGRRHGGSGKMMNTYEHQTSPDKDQENAYVRRIKEVA